MRRILFILLALFVAYGCNKGGQEGKKESAYVKELVPGKPAVDFQYRDINQNRFRLSEQKGKVVILYFWRMKCEDCKTEMKSLEELHRRYKDKGLLVVSVGADTMHSASIHKVKEFFDQSKLTFTLIRDDEGFVSEAFEVFRAPTAFVIDKNGIIADVKNGVKTDWASPEMMQSIEKLLK